MPEREWYEFDDPEVEGITWKVDVTFLRTRWNCLYGCGCPGILEGATPADGCCNYGAWFSGKEDRERVAGYARRLRPEEWQYWAHGHDGFGTRKTKLVAGACVFLNRAGFPGGEGCALHLAALRAHESPLDWKPDVCWQVPLRFRQEAEGVYIIEEFSRATWGPGGEQFSWWCTESSLAQTGAQPVYRSMAPELRRMMGDGAYERLARYLDRRTKRVVLHVSERA